MRHLRYEAKETTTLTDVFHTGQPMSEFLHAMSASIPEPVQPRASSELSSHGAFHKKNQ